MQALSPQKLLMWAIKVSKSIVIGLVILVSVALLCILFVRSGTAGTYRQTGIASWYGTESGPRTSNGERWDPHGMTAASWALNFNTRVLVTHLKSGKSVVVRISDRGPAKKLHRIIDLSEEAAKRLGMKNSGIASVLVEEIR